MLSYMSSFRRDRAHNFRFYFLYSRPPNFSTSFTRFTPLSRFPPGISQHQSCYHDFMIPKIYGDFRLGQKKCSDWEMEDYFIRGLPNMTEDLRYGHVLQLVVMRHCHTSEISRHQSCYHTASTGGQWILRLKNFKEERRTTLKNGNIQTVLYIKATSAFDC